MAHSAPAGMYLDEFTILEQPVDCAALVGDKASFSVTAYGDDLTYQWEASRDGVNWTASTAASSQTDTISGITVTEDRIGRWYRCRVTDTNGTEIVSSHVMIRRPFDTWEYTYNADGLRVGKTNTETTYQYYYNGDKLSRMNVDYADPDVEDQELHFGYDASGVPQYVDYNGTRYFYLTNLQGDVTGIVSAKGTPVVDYTYDAWGKNLGVEGVRKENLGRLNPLRYRGYVYDEETKLYYLQSRYYDPALGRFINADVYASTGQGLLGNNMFAYCNNNSVYSYDDTGCYPIAVEDKYIHDQVLKNICAWNSDLTYQNTCVYYNQNNWLGGFGFCDLYNHNTGEVWELKKANFTSYSCSTPAAQAQLLRYTNGRLKYAPDLDLTTPYKTIIPTRVFEVATPLKIYSVSYWYEGDGILRYTYASKNTAAGYILETLAVLALLLAAVCGYPVTQ